MKNDREAFGVYGGQTDSPMNPFTDGVENLFLDMDGIEEVDESHRDFDREQFLKAMGKT